MATERLAAALTPLVGRGEAKSALARASRRVAEEGITLDDALAEDPALGGLLPEGRLRELTDPTRCTGSAGELVDRALRRPGPAGTSP